MNAKLIAVFIVLAVVAFLAAGYMRLLRPWYLTWGATPDEQTMALAGDDLVPNLVFRMTHAITINAPASEVWPWIVQIGQGRGGYYSYERLERLFGFGIYNVYRIVPELQNLKEGDFVRLHKNGIGTNVVSLEKGRSLVLCTDSRKPAQGRREFVPVPKGKYIVYNWSFNLIDRPDGTTRLVERWAAEWTPTNPFLNLALCALFELPSFIMEHRMLYEIKQCAEGNPPRN